MKRLLLLQLGANGDCVYTTTLLRQMKQDFPGCHITWVIDRKYVSVLDNNPFLDSIWVVDPLPNETANDLWRRVSLEAAALKKDGRFDEVFDVQIYPENVSGFDGTIRSSTFRNYPYRVTVPVSPVVCLRNEEFLHVRAYAERCKLSQYSKVVLMECSPSSGQSRMTLERGLRLAAKIVATYPDAAVVVSTHLDLTGCPDRIFSARELSYRENIALAEYCTHFIGCGSGISWLMIAEGVKQLPMIQILEVRNGFFASMAHDLAFFGYKVEHILETDETNEDVWSEIAIAALIDFAGARRMYHRALKPCFWRWVNFVDYRHGVFGLLKSCRLPILFLRRTRYSFLDLFDFYPLVQALKHAAVLFGHK